MYFKLAKCSKPEKFNQNLKYNAQLPLEENFRNLVTISNYDHFEKLSKLATVTSDPRRQKMNVPEHGIITLGELGYKCKMNCMCCAFWNTKYQFDLTSAEEKILLEHSGVTPCRFKALLNTLKTPLGY